MLTLEGFAVCDECGKPLIRGDHYVYIETRRDNERVCWHKECFDRTVKPFEGSYGQPRNSNEGR